MDLTCSFQINATLVANDFIDRYMVSANGEYVKVYLYILRHQQEQLDISTIADALNHTESDVRRALSYWEKLGALRMGQKQKEPELPTPEYVQSCAGGSSKLSSGITIQPDLRTGAEQNTVSAAETAAARPVYSQDQVNLLAGDEDFSQLLYIAQKYLNKVFTPRECEVFAYLYDGLHISAELLEYLVEYCVQCGHTNIRYIETVALSWHEKGLVEVEAAKAYTSGFTKNSFAVMRAFGLTDRKPGASEKEMIERWFLTYGFTRELVLEACNRTMEATHTPSFRYADKILSEWKKAGVKSLRDVASLDQKRQERQERQNVPRSTGSRKPANQFHNFEQRDTDYDSMVMDQVKSWITEP